MAGAAAPAETKKKRLTPDRLLDVGVVHKPHGLKGAVTIGSHTRPAIGIAGYSFWWLGQTPEAATRYAVHRCWQHGRRVLAELEGISDCNGANALKQMHIWVPADEMLLNEDEYLWADLVGCEVCRVGHGGDGLLGTVVALEDYGAQDILVVRTPGNTENPGEWMLPFISHVVLDVDITTRCITVDLPEGMNACFTPRS